MLKFFNGYLHFTLHINNNNNNIRLNTQDYNISPPPHFTQFLSETFFRIIHLRDMWAARHKPDTLYSLCFSYNWLFSVFTFLRLLFCRFFVYKYGNFILERIGILYRYFYHATSGFIRIANSTLYSMSSGKVLRYPEKWKVDSYDGYAFLTQAEILHCRWNFQRNVCKNSFVVRILPVVATRTQIVFHAFATVSK